MGTQPAIAQVYSCALSNFQADIFFFPRNHRYKTLAQALNPVSAVLHCTGGGVIPSAFGPAPGGIRLSFSLLYVCKKQVSRIKLK